MPQIPGDAVHARPRGARQATHRRSGRVGLGDRGRGIGSEQGRQAGNVQASEVHDQGVDASFAPPQGAGVEAQLQASQVQQGVRRGFSFRQPEQVFENQMAGFGLAESMLLCVAVINLHHFMG